MEERRKYTVGTDNATADTLRTTMAKEAAMHLARVYKQARYPIPLEFEFDVDGLAIEVRVREKVKDE